MNIPKECPYCKSEVIKTTNDKIYGKKYGNGMCFMCTGCDSYVGCHDDGRPLGIIANKELRDLKRKAHSLFDPYWKTGKMKRKSAYRKLARQLEIPVNDCHFGHFNKGKLIQAIDIIKEWSYSS